MDLTPSANAALAPDRQIKSLANPGEIGRQVALALASQVTPTQIGETINDLLAATRLTKYGTEPDTRAREAGVKLWLAYMVGLPIQRQELVTVNLDADSEVGVRERLRASPALRKAMRRILDELDAVEA